MDPVSLTASIVAIIQIANTIISTCGSYVATVKDAPTDLRTILIEVGSVRSVLEVLELLVQGNPDDSTVILKQLKGSNGALNGCLDCLTTLDSLFPKAESDAAAGKRRKTLASLTNLAWPFKADRARKNLRDLERHKATISLVLATESTHDIKDIKKEVRCLHDTLDETQRQSVLKWLVVTDPSSMHNEAQNLHEPYTSEWLVRLPAYCYWIQGSVKFLWLHGIPGSGKTILASFVVEEVQKTCKTTNSSAIGWAYYYFYFRREKDEVADMLRWVINQLCRQLKHIPSKVRDCHSGGVQPSILNLMDALSELLQGFERVYLVLDALDESKNRPNLLSGLRMLLQDPKFDKLQIFATSREELDIEIALKDISTDISLHNQWVDEDIQNYIKNHLQIDKMSRWPGALKAEIEAALVKGAKGMFRWVICQLDILSRLKSASDIRSALEQLPKTLDETYERILDNIPVEHCQFVRRTLHLLCFGLRISTLAALAEAVIVDDNDCSFDVNDRFLDPRDILEICTCLITFDEGHDPEVRLAHYSVQEYLVSDRVKITMFQTSKLKANILAAKIYITYYLNLDYTNFSALEEIINIDEGEDQQSSVEKFCKIYPLLRDAYYFSGAVKASQKDKVVNDLVLKLLNPSRPHFNTWFSVWITTWRYIPLFSSRRPYYQRQNPEWRFVPGTEATATLVYLCRFDLEYTAKLFLERNRDPHILENEIEYSSTKSLGYIVHNGGTRLNLNAILDNDPGRTGYFLSGTPLHVAAAFSSVNFIKLLVSKGASINAVSKSGWTALSVALVRPYISSKEAIDLLLAANANVNPPDAALSPLQCLATNRYTSCLDQLVERLIAHGADVNAVGNDAAVIAKIRYDLRAEHDPNVVKEVLHDRRRGMYYDTPLRILEKRSENDPSFRGRKSALRRARRLLIEAGAISLHITPKDIDCEVPSKSGTCIEDKREGSGNVTN